MTGSRGGLVRLAVLSDTTARLAERLPSVTVTRSDDWSSVGRGADCLLVDGERWFAVDGPPAVSTPVVVAAPRERAVSLAREQAVDGVVFRDTLRNDPTRATARIAAVLVDEADTAVSARVADAVGSAPRRGDDEATPADDPPERTTDDADARTTRTPDDSSSNPPSADRPTTPDEGTEPDRHPTTDTDLIDVVREAVAVHDPETGAIVDANEAYLTLAGYSDRESLRAARLRGLHPDAKGYTAEQGRRLVRRVHETGDGETVAWAAETSDGRRRFESTLTPATVGGRDRVVAVTRDVTARRRRRREYEQIFDSVEDGISLIDPETMRIVDANEAYLDMLGYETVEAVREAGVGGLSLTEEGYTVDAGRGIHERIADRGESETVEWRAETNDGERLWLAVTITPAVIEGQQLNISVHRDVTDRRRRERAIGALGRASERMQTAERRADVARVVVETAGEMTNLPHVVCWLRDGDGGMTAASATDDTPVERFSPERYEYRALQDGPVTVWTPEDAWFETAVLLPLDDHGVVVAGARTEQTVDDAVLDVVRALADHATTALTRVERERAVRENERRFRLIADRIDEVIYLADPGFSDVSYVNPAYEEIWGRETAELYEDATSFVDGIDPRDADRFRREFDAMLADFEGNEADDQYTFEYRVKRPDGEVRWVEATGYPVDLSDRDARFVGVVKDTTERKRREQRLEVFNRVLRHNLRNQLDVIRAHAEAVGGDHADRILAAADRLAAVGEQARTVDRMMARDRRPEPVDLSATVATVTDRVADDAQVTTETPETAVVETDRTVVDTVLTSAVENAVEYADCVTVRVERTGGACVIEVIDNGPGIPASQLDSLRRGTETELRHSRGLGLWQLRWGVDTINGELSFDTDDGTTVRLVIPNGA